MAVKAKNTEPETLLKFGVILRGSDRDKKITKKELDEITKVVTSEVIKRLAVK